MQCVYCRKLKKHIILHYPYKNILCLIIKTVDKDEGGDWYMSDSIELDCSL